MDYVISQADSSMQRRFAALQKIFVKLHERCLKEGRAMPGARAEWFKVSDFDLQANAFELSSDDACILVRMHYAPTGDTRSRAKVRFYGVGADADEASALSELSCVEVVHDGQAVRFAGGADAVCVDDADVVVEILAQMAQDCLHLNSAV